MIGYCDREGKRILLTPGSDPDAPETVVVLIHEAVHAVSNGRHGAPFLRRLEAAARRAAKIGRPDLERLLTLEVARYQGTPRQRAAEVYSMIEDAIEVDGLNEQEALNGVSEFLGSTLRNFRKDFPRAHEVAAKAARRRKIEEKRRASFGAVRKAAGPLV